MEALTSADVLGQQGLLARYIAGFTPRASQLAMAMAIEEALVKRETLIVEAGTGTGKTFAYLVPALLSGQKVIISTGTKNLQDQLFYQDLPVVHKALGIPLKAALLKGRSNYLCRYRLKNAYHDGRFLSKQFVHDLHAVYHWSAQTQDGDISTLENVSETAAVWPAVTSTADNCLGQECSYYSDCFLIKARRLAQEADVVVVNHHLFFADMSLREEGFGEVLPGAHAVIFDEAHQVMEVASHYFGTAITSRQLLELARDTESEYLRSALDMAALKEISTDLQQAVADMRLALGRERQREPWYKIAAKPALKTAITAVTQQLTALAENLQLAAERHKGLENCWKRCVSLAERFSCLTKSAPEQYIHWYETFTQAFSITHTPLNVAEQFQTAMRAHPKTWIFTSATIAIGKNFQHFQASLGLDTAKCMQLNSPFDYRQQSLMYLPSPLPDPQDSTYLHKVIAAAVPVIEASRGRTFFLFTSHRALLQAAEIIGWHINYPILVQGSMPKLQLLQRYKELGNAVLLGTGSFWEGVDVRGEALSCVIIDKLPFAMPDDPLMKAHIQSLKKQGKDAFKEYQLPQAVITLKQGAGRLIRDYLDRGVLMLCDPRLLTRDYGQTFLESLPDMPITTHLKDVKHFFAATSNEMLV